jgi:mannosyltransferase
MTTTRATRTTTRRPSTTVLAVAGLTLVALGLRAACLDESFFGDELFTHLISTRPDLQAVLAGVRSNLEISPPLYFVVAWLFAKVGDPFVWLRMASLLAGAATVPLVYVLGARTVGRAAALAGTAFFALSPFAIFYASEARAYALMTLLVVLSTLSLLRALETNDRRWWAAFALLQAASMYTHYTAAFVLAAQAGWALLTHRDRRVPLLVSSGAAALLFLPWLPEMIDDSNAPNQRIIGAFEPFGFETVARNTARLTDGGPFAPLTDLPGTPAFVMLALATLIGLAGLVLALRRGPRPDPRSRAVLIGLLALAAPVGASLYSAASDDIYVARNLISSLPYLALALGALLTALPRRASVPALALALAALAIGAFGTLERDTQRPGYAAAAEFVEARSRPGDVVLDLNPFPGPPSNALDVHLDGSQPVFKLGYPGEERRAVRAAGDSGRTLYVRPEIGVVRGAVPPSLRGRRELASQTWSGWFPLTVVVYAPRG